MESECSVTIDSVSFIASKNCTLFLSSTVLSIVRTGLIGVAARALAAAFGSAVRVLLLLITLDEVSTVIVRVDDEPTTVLVLVPAVSIGR